jgi:predicted Zn finger-like uncharacterized protein
MKVQCPSCSTAYTIQPVTSATRARCKNCGNQFVVEPQQAYQPGIGLHDDWKGQESLPAERSGDGNMNCKEYKVMRIVESGLGTIFLGAAAVPLKKMEAALNKEVTSGWQVVFQVIEQKRFLLFWKREAVIITLGR